MKRHSPWLLPLLFLLAISPFSSWFDLKIAHLFYFPFPEGKGHFFENAFTHWMFRYGERIGLVVGAISVGVYLSSWIFSRLRPLRKGALVLVLTLVVGAGVITNSLLKEYWGRPRPKQVEEFGGKHAFRPFYRPDFHTRNDPQKSFPSGHVAMGFYYLAICLVAKRYKNRPLFLLALLLTLFFGLGLMITRVVQGGHFLSDTLWSALIMWLSAYFADQIVFRKSLSTSEEFRERWKKEFSDSGDTPRESGAA